MRKQDHLRPPERGLLAWDGAGTTWDGDGIGVLFGEDRFLSR
ncbi:MAG TPA: hypothetical protein VF576_10570 [Rubricoccaceae bacterium]